VGRFLGAGYTPTMPDTGRVSTDDYRRQARRLRGALASQPGRLHFKLRELALRHDGGTTDVESAAPLRSRSVPPRADAFADEVATSLDGPVLRYSQRRGLIRTARRLGMGDFEANLVIAAVQHERRSAPVAAASKLDEKPRSGLRLPDLAPLLVVIAVESMVGLGIWRVCFG
jgi:hypothetical protein